MYRKCKMIFLIQFLLLGIAFAEAPIICLTMIVKNESAIIERCLESVKDIIDCVSICDTGSSDNTVEIIEEFLAKNSIPGKVIQHEWKDFGYNRTLSVKEARKTLIDLDFSLSDAYLLLIDADMTLKISSEFEKSSLFKDQYFVLQKLGDLSYYNTRLVKASFPWKSIGVTHEYWACERATSEDKLTSLSIDDRGDGGCKADKFERDVKLLKKGLQNEPSNVRYMFYLAESYKNLGQYQDALNWYQKRISFGGWKEEVWYAKFMIGTVYEELGKWDEALNAYLDAYQYLPNRSEPLEKIAVYYRKKGENSLSHLFATTGSKIPYPKEQLLFISDPVYQYRFDEELSIAAYYTPFNEEGAFANDRLLFNKMAPDSVRYQALNNSRFYAKNFENIRIHPLTMKLPLIKEGSDLTYNPMNPSIVKTQDGYYVVCRCVNYQQKGAKYFWMIDPEMQDEYIGKTRNFLIKYDKNFNLLSQKEILDEISKSLRIPPYSNVEGLDDIRLFEYEGSLWFTANVHDMNYHHIPQIGLFKLEDSPGETQIFTDQFTLLLGPDPKRCEKNWLPFVKDGAIHLIYSYDPYVVYKVDSEHGSCEEVISEKQKNDFSSFRGSAGPIPFDEGYLSVIHQVAWDDQGRYYLHRFLYLDKDYKIQRISKPFTYTHQGVEYCCGITLDHVGTNLIMSIGIEDAEAAFVIVDLNILRSSLFPIK